MDAHNIKPQIIVLGGFPGTGKSTIVRELRDHFKFPENQIVSSDRMLKQICAERMPGFDSADEVPDDIYNNPKVKLELARRFYSRARALVDEGKPALMHSAFTSRFGRMSLALGTVGKPTTGFWLEADYKILQERLQNRRQENLSCATASPERLADVFKRNASIPKGWTPVSTQGVTPRDVAAVIWGHLDHQHS